MDFARHYVLHPNMPLPVGKPGNALLGEYMLTNWQLVRIARLSSLELLRHRQRSRPGSLVFGYLRPWPPLTVYPGVGTGAVRRAAMSVRCLRPNNRRIFRRKPAHICSRRLNMALRVATFEPHRLGWFTMSADAVVRSRIDADTKRRAAAALAAMGLTISEAIRLLLLRVADEQCLPFDVKVPNVQSRQAMRELAEGRGKRSASAAALFKDLGI